MPEVIRLMILEDEPDCRDALVRAFRENTDYQFEVEVADSPEDCIAKDLDKKDFDVYLVDLEIRRGVRPFFGQSFIEIRAFEVPGSLTVVYSCHQHIETITRASRHGTADFIVKSECCPHDVPKRIVRLLDDRRREAEQHRQLVALIAEKGEVWRKQYPGQVLVLINGEPALSENTRLRALVTYNTLWEQHTDWPKEPLLLEISRLDEVSE